MKLPMIGSRNHRPHTALTGHSSPSGSYRLLFNSAGMMNQTTGLMKIAEDHADGAADALAAVLLEVLELPVRPDPRVDAERDDRQQDHRPGVGRPTDRAPLARLAVLRHAPYWVAGTPPGGSGGIGVRGLLTVVGHVVGPRLAVPVPQLVLPRGIRMPTGFL